MSNKVIGPVPARVQAAIAELRLALAKELISYQDYAKEYDAILDRRGVGES